MNPKKLLALFICLLMVVGLMPVSALAELAPVSSGTAERTYETYAKAETRGGAILHCFDWSYNAIKDALPDIARAGYTAVQTSPVQQPKDYSADYTDGAGQWWKLYQPLGFRIAPDGTSWLGTKAELTALCAEARNYGIKVIVDIVANHLANNGSDGGTYAYLNPLVDSELQNPAYYHTNNNYANDDSRYNITQYHIGMPDLNTGNSFVQNSVLDLIEECLDCGVDGFRFDAAKHIETPYDDQSFASSFWSTVVQGGDYYSIFEADSDDYFCYGEILGAAGPNFAITNYTEYIAVTDNYTGDRALDKAYYQWAPELADSTYYKGAAPSDSVLWVESHDTYMGNSGTAGFPNTSSISDDVIIRAWAVVGSRADSTALFFARPNSVMGAASTDQTWKDAAVAEVNKFKTFFSGTAEYLSASGTNAVVNERGNKGAVVSKLDGGGQINAQIYRMKDGVYTDQVSGNTFTVSNGYLSGTVGASGVAVIYDPSSSPVDLITEARLFLAPASNWFNDGARFAAYFYNVMSGAAEWVSMTESDQGVYYADVPAGHAWTNVIFCRMDPASSVNGWDSRWNQTDDLFPDEGTNLYTVAEGTWSNGGGAWSHYDDPGSWDNLVALAAAAASGSTLVLDRDYIHISGGSDLVLNGKTLTIDLNGHKLTSDAIDKLCHPIIVSDGADLTVTDSSSGNTGEIDFSAGNIRVLGSLTLDGVSVSGAEQDDGGAVYVDDNASLTVIGGSVSGTSNGRGGAIYAGSGAHITLDGCVVSGASAAQGGGIFSAGILTLDSCVIEDCTAVGDGGGIYAAFPLTLNGAAVTGCSANWGAGIYLDGVMLTVSGAVVVEDNQGCGGSPSDVYVSAPNTLLFSGPLSAESRIGLCGPTEVSPSYSMVVSSGFAESGSSPDCFFPDTDALALALDPSGEIRIGAAYTISFLPGEGSGSMADLILPYGSSLTCPECVFTPPAGKEFLFWDGVNYDIFPGGSATVASGDTLTAVFAMRGDMDDNGRINAADALLVFRLALGLLPATQAQLAIADFDGDGTLGVIDALCVMRAALGLPW